MRSNQLSYAPEHCKFILHGLPPVVNRFRTEKKNFVPFSKIGRKTRLRRSFMKKYLNAEETLVAMIDYITVCLEEIASLDEKDLASQFQRGQETALVECLELIQRWEKASENGLDFNIEETFPV